MDKSPFEFRLAARYRIFRHCVLDWLLGWGKLSKKKTKEAHMSDKESIGFISDLVLALLFGVIPMPAAIRWVGWILCWIGFLYILQKVIEPINRLPRKSGSLGVLVLVAVFILVFRTTAISMWSEEKASQLEGDLVGAGPAIDDGKQHGFPMLQIGETTYVMTPNGVADIFPFFKDSGVRIE